MIAGVIFDVDGVLVDSPHERAWREALQDLLATDWRGLVGNRKDLEVGLTTAIYQAFVAGKPRLAGARAVLEYFSLPDPEQRAVEYAARKQERLVELIAAGQFTPFEDGLSLVAALKQRGFRLAAASSSENANGLMAQIRLHPPALASPAPTAHGRADRSLLEAFDGNVCGWPVARGKPDPELFLLAAQELRLQPGVCLVVEDAPAGVEAAQAGGMLALGVARLNDDALLTAAGADLVVPTLDLVDVDALVAGRLERRSTPPARPAGAETGP